MYVRENICISQKTICRSWLSSSALLNPRNWTQIFRFGCKPHNSPAPMMATFFFVWIKGRYLINWVLLFCFVFSSSRNWTTVGTQWTTILIMEIKHGYYQVCVCVCVNFWLNLVGFFQLFYIKYKIKMIEIVRVKS